MWNQNPSFRFEIDNFSDKEDVLASKDFVAGGCEWYLAVQPKGDYNDQLCLFLYVANRESLRTGWKRSAKYYFLVLNESNKELYKSSILGKKSKLFSAENPAWGSRKTLPFSKFQEKGFLKNDKLIVEVYINVVEAFDGEGGDINACSKLSDDGSLVQQLEERIKTLELMVSGFEKDSSKRKKSHATDERRFQKLEDSFKNLGMMELGFKLNSLKSKLAEVSLVNKKLHDADKARAQLLEGRVKKIELMETGSKLDSLRLKLEEITLERKKSYDAEKSRVQQLEERIKNIELMDIGFMLDCVNTRPDNDDESRFQQLEKSIENMSKNVGFALDCLNTKIEEVSLESKKSDDARFQQVEKSVKNIELMLSCLEVELDKKKDKSGDDGFLLVD